MTIILPNVVCIQPQIFPKFYEEYASLFVHSRLFLQSSLHDAVTTPNMFAFAEDTSMRYQGLIHKKASKCGNVRS